MKIQVIYLLIIGFYVFSLNVFADERCGEGKIFSRDTISCIQETCPAGTGRNYGGICQCYNSDWGAGQEVRSDCRDQNGLLTHCVKEGETCDGKVVNATTETEIATDPDPQSVRPSIFRSMLNFLQSLGLFRTSSYDQAHPQEYVTTSVLGKASNFIKNIFE